MRTSCFDEESEVEVCQGCGGQNVVPARSNGSLHLHDAKEQPHSPATNLQCRVPHQALRAHISRDLDHTALTSINCPERNVCSHHSLAGWLLPGGGAESKECAATSARRKPHVIVQGIFRLLCVFWHASKLKKGRTKEKKRKMSCVAPRSRVPAV